MKKNINKNELLNKGNNTVKEFKKFISRGNVVDLAVGVIVGGAFGNIITSVVNDVLMPLLGIVIGGLDFSNLVVQVGDASIRYGAFIQNVIDFLIVAFCIFIFVKIISKFNKKEQEESDNKKDEELVLLEEIRDLLKEGNSLK